MKHWTETELGKLKAMRERFLTGNAGAVDYWRSAEDLELYDRVFAERIGWKIDAVLTDLARIGWSPVSRQVLDWGCGTGIAGRRVLQQWESLETLSVHDRSPMAMRFAADKAAQKFPKVSVKTFDRVEGETLLVLSHVLSELSEKGLAALLSIARQATEILWIEAGTHRDSRDLIAVRETLLSEVAADGSPQFHVIAPCTHRARCGMLTSKNALHWCHHFGSPPSEIFQDAVWMEFGREMGIDLRSLPYSYLVLSRERSSMPAGYSRIIGSAREAKGYMKVLSCQQSGVTEPMLQKRDEPELFRAFHKGTVEPVQRWKFHDGKIIASEPLPR